MYGATQGKGARTLVIHGCYQFAAVLVSFGIAVIGGAITGKSLRDRLSRPNLVPAKRFYCSRNRFFHKNEFSRVTHFRNPFLPHLDLIWLTEREFRELGRVLVLRGLNDLIFTKVRSISTILLPILSMYRQYKIKRFEQKTSNDV